MVSIDDDICHCWMLLSPTNRQRVILMGWLMGYAQKRLGRDGKPRYTAVYHDIRGERRSAGTFSSKKEANTAWQRAEAKTAEGRLNDPRRGRQTFHRYVTEEWLPNHVMEATTREAYTYQINKHILTWFGPMRMNEIMQSHVREWITELQAKGVTPVTLKKLRFVFQRDLHDRAGRRNLPAPVQRCEDAHRLTQASEDHHARAIRCDLRGASRP